jgi:tetratricopeptide (TPR) repeat protein
MSNMKNSTRLAFLFFILAATVVPARAEDKAAARAAFAEARRQYDLNEFQAALDAFKRAYLNYEDPAFLYNIAQCHRQLDHKSEAVKFYRSYLRNVPDARNRDEVNALVASLEAQLAAENDAAKARAREQAATAAATATATTPATTPATSLTSAPPPARPQTPTYKKWWVWTIVGVVAAGAATGVGVALGTRRTEPSFMPVTVTQ